MENVSISENKPKVIEAKKVQVELSVIRYCWGNESCKTWFITKSSKAWAPKGSRILLKIDGELTSEPICSTAIPQKGDVVCDTDGIHIKINKVSWV